MLLIVRETEIMQYEPPPPGVGALPDTHIFASAGPFRNIIQGPLSHDFDMSTPDSRDDAYDWIAMRLHHQPTVRLPGIMTQEDSAIMTNNPPLALQRVMRAFDLMNSRFHIVRFTPTSVFLTVLADYFGPVHARSTESTRGLGLRGILRIRRRISGEFLTATCGTSHMIGIDEEFQQQLCICTGSACFFPKGFF
jgi:hypothetical protein